VSETNPLSDARRVLLKRCLGGHAGRGVLNGPPARARQTIGVPMPLSLAQEQIWWNAQQTGVPPFYNESITIHRRGSLDPIVLERCMREILRRHEAWRTTFAVRAQHPVQIVQPVPASLPLDPIDLRPLPESEREDQALQRAKAEVQRPFDLEKGPLFRATLVRLADEDYRLYLSVHQIIIDGVTAYHVFLPELASLYEAFSQGKPSPLPEPSIQYSDFCGLQRQSLREPQLASQIAYWRASLDGALPALRWPNDHPRPVKQTLRGLIYPFRLSNRLSRAVRELSQSAGVTLFVTLLTGLFILLHRYTGQEDIVVGTVSPAGRKRIEVQNLMGYFLNPVALRLRLAGDPTINDLLVRVQQVVVGAVSNDDIPFERLVEILRPKDDSSRNPFFQVAASLEPSMPNIDSSWSLTPMDAESGGARWDLYLVWDDRPSGIIGRVQYNPDLLDRATVTATLRYQEILLDQMVTDLRKRLSELTFET